MPPVQRLFDASVGGTHSYDFPFESRAAGDDVSVRKRASRATQYGGARASARKLWLVHGGLARQLGTAGLHGIVPHKLEYLD